MEHAMEMDDMGLAHGLETSRYWDHMEGKKPATTSMENFLATEIVPISKDLGVPHISNKPL